MELFRLSKRFIVSLQLIFHGLGRARHYFLLPPMHTPGAYSSRRYRLFTVAGKNAQGKDHCGLVPNARSPRAALLLVFVVIFPVRLSVTLCSRQRVRHGLCQGKGRDQHVQISTPLPPSAAQPRGRAVRSGGVTGTKLDG